MTRNVGLYRVKSKFLPEHAPWSTRGSFSGAGGRLVDHRGPSESLRLEGPNVSITVTPVTMNVLVFVK